MFKSMAVALLWSLADKLLGSLWDGLKDFVVEKAVEAEKKWKEKGKGVEKKEFVLELVTGWLKEKTSLNFVARGLVRNAISYFLDVLIRLLNDYLGNDWGEKAEELMEEHKSKLPFF